MKIQVLGSGCPTCKKLHEVVTKIVKEESIDAQIEYLTGAEGMQKIIEMNQMSSPILVVNEKVVMVGFSPDTNKIKTAITSGLMGNTPSRACSCGGSC